MFADVFVFYMYVRVLSFVFGTFAAVYFRFRFHSLFVSRKLCVKHYASFCIFMQSKNVYLCKVLW